MATTELSKSMNEFLAKLQDDLKEAMNTMMCTKCEGKHKCVLLSPSLLPCDLMQTSVLCYMCTITFWAVISSAGALRWTAKPAKPASVLNVKNGTVLRRAICGLNLVCWVCESHTSLLWMAKSLISLVADLHPRLLIGCWICIAFVAVYWGTSLYVHTEWAGCQRISISPDTHRVPYHISFGSKGSSSSTSRHR